MANPLTWIKQSVFSRKSDKKRPKRTIRKTIRRMMLLLAALIALLYTAIVFRFYSVGLDDSIIVTFVFEARTFSQQYEATPEDKRVIPSTPTRPGYIGWENVPSDLQALFPQANHKVDELITYSNLDQQSDHHQGTVVFLFISELTSGERLYLFSIFDLSLITDDEFEAFEDKLNFTLPLGLALLALALIIATLLSRRISQSTNNLAQWADQLTLNDISSPRPALGFYELDRVADRLQESVQRIGALLTKEHVFLRNASHELRTPIAVSRANLEILTKIGIEPHQEIPIERIRRANLAMQNLTETLLWLSRDHHRVLASSPVKLAEQVSQQCKDLHYLLEGKDVKVELELAKSPTIIELPSTALQIVLHNLIRNAFQYTDDGVVRISQHGSIVRVDNENNSPQQGEHPDSIGLGLQLVSQICDRLNWTLELNPSPFGIDATLTLPSSPSSMDSEDPHQE